MHSTGVQERKRVRLKVEGGVIDVFHIPEGIEVEVIDYDVEGGTPEEMDNYAGEDCVHYVTFPDEGCIFIRDCEYDNDDDWRKWSESGSVPEQAEHSPTADSSATGETPPESCDGRE